MTYSRAFNGVASPAKDRQIFGVKVGRPLDRNSSRERNGNYSEGRSADVKRYTADTPTGSCHNSPRSHGRRTVPAMPYLESSNRKSITDPMLNGSTFIAEASRSNRDVNRGVSTCHYQQESNKDQRRFDNSVLPLRPNRVARTNEPPKIPKRETVGRSSYSIGDSSFGRNRDSSYDGKRRSLGQGVNTPTNGSRIGGVSERPKGNNPNVVTSSRGCPPIFCGSSASRKVPRDVPSDCLPRRSSSRDPSYRERRSYSTEPTADGFCGMPSSNNGELYTSDSLDMGQRYRKDFMRYSGGDRLLLVEFSTVVNTIKCDIKESYSVDDNIGTIVTLPHMNVESGLKAVMQCTGKEFAKDTLIWKKQVSALKMLNETMKRDFRLGEENNITEPFDRKLLSNLKVAIDDTLGSGRSTLTKISAEVWGRLLVGYGQRMQFDGSSADEVAILLLRKAIVGVNPDFVSSNSCKAFLAWSLFLPVSILSRTSRLLANNKYNPLLLLQGLLLTAIRVPNWLEENWRSSRAYYDALTGYMKSTKKNHREIACAIVFVYMSASIKHGPFYKYLQLEGIPLSAQYWFIDNPGNSVLHMLGIIQGSYLTR